VAPPSVETTMPSGVAAQIQGFLICRVLPAIAGAVPHKGQANPTLGHEEPRSLIRERVVFACAEMRNPGVHIVHTLAVGLCRT
jgi:hypothetical protein